MKMASETHNLAAIDAGTNSFHLIVVNIREDGNFEIIDREKEVIRLGEGSSSSIKYIKPEAMDRAVVTLKRFRQIAVSHDATIRAVATSAVREAYNKNDFLHKVLHETAIEIEVISGFEEARLIYLGALRAVPVFNKKALIVDIGGGSTELIVGTRGNTNFSASLALGAVSLTERFFPDFEISDSRLKECKRWVEGEISRTVNAIHKTGFSICVGTSGTIMSAGLVAQALRKGNIAPNAILNNYELRVKDFEQAKNEILSRRSFERRKKIPGLDENRADIIPAGIIILAALFEMLDLQSITISGYSLREGIVIDSIRKLYPDLPRFSDGRGPNLSDIGDESIKQISKN